MNITIDEFVKSVEDSDLARGRLALSIPLTPPSGNHYKKPRAVPGHGISWFLTTEAKVFKAAVATIAAGRTISPATERDRAKVSYRVTVTVTLGPKQRQDADNGLKVALDSLTACGVIHSDARVAEAIGRVVWDQRKFGPRTVIVVERLDTTTEAA